MTKPEVRPLVPSGEVPAELTWRALILGIVLSVILGAASATLGLGAGQTIAATVPAAVVAMAFLRIFKGTLLEENVARTTGSVGEALVTGASFTVPALLLAGVWTDLTYSDGTLLLLVGGLLGVFFAVMLRRVVVDDRTLAFPESVAAAEIHMAVQKGRTGVTCLFSMMGLGALIEILKSPKGIQVFEERVTGWWTYGSFKTSIGVEGGTLDSAVRPGVMPLCTPAASPAFLAVGYLIGARPGAMAFAGGVFAWWILVPLVLFIHPELVGIAETDWAAGNGPVIFDQVGNQLVRPIALGVMVIGALWSLTRMRKPFIEGIGSSVSELNAALDGEDSLIRRIDRDLPITWTAAAVLALAVPATILCYYAGGQSWAALALAVAALVVGFGFCAVTGHWVGIVGASSTPISGLSLLMALLAGLLVTAWGVAGVQAVGAVVGVAVVVGCASAVARNLIQDFAVGRILGGTPSRMQLAEILGVVVSAPLVMLPLIVLHAGDIKAGGQGIGGPELPAPQAAVLAMLSKGLVEGGVAWPLIVFGMALGVMLLLVRAPSPLLVAAGMYLPLHTTFAIFLGGVIRWILERRLKRLGDGVEEKRRGEETGTLLASGLIAGQALMGVGLSALVLLGIGLPEVVTEPRGWPGLGVILILGWILVWLPTSQFRRDRNLETQSG